MRVSFSYTFFVNRGEIVNVAFDLLTNGSEKVVKPKKKKLKKHWTRSAFFPVTGCTMITQYRLQFLVFSSDL